MKRLAIGILAHVDSGKTTLSEALLYRCGEIRRLGRVDHKTAFLDTHTLERDRGITIFSKQALLHLKNSEFTLLDTPGHVDFSPEMERTLQVLDYAILVINGAEGVQSHTQTLWRLLLRYQIPTFVFVNKMDLAGADQAAAMAELKRQLDEGCVDFTAGQDKEDFWESLALCDESLMEQILDTGNAALKDICRGIAHRKVFPCYFGSALKLWGVDELLQGLEAYTRMPAWGSAFGASVFKIAKDEQGNRLTYCKITGGRLNVKDLITRSQGEQILWSEKVNQIRIYSGAKFQAVDEALPGMVCALTGLTHTSPGEGLGAATDAAGPMLEPVLTYRVNLPLGTDIHGALTCLRRLEEEEPQLHVLWNELLQEIQVQLMGEVQLEVLKSLLLQRFGLEVSFAQGNIVYKESILAPVEGVGHYEPLRHYAEVHLLLEPLPRGSGLQFGAACREDELDKNWQRLILTHLEEKVHRGVLTGSPITDMRITLVAGRAHQKHTEGGDFRQATYRAVRQGLKCAQSVLLEPWYDFQLEVPTDCVGRAMSDLQRMEADIFPPEVQGDFSLLRGSGPVAAMREYHLEVTGYTRGKGRLSCIPCGYRPCHNAQQVVDTLGYDSDRDLDNPADSIFCSHGAGYVVKWDQVREHMHVASPLELQKPAQSQNKSLQQRAEKYCARLAEDQELMRIFERTYGPIRQNPLSAFRPASKPTSAQEAQLSLPQPQEGPEYLLVDGYNIIFAWEDLQQLARDDMAAARSRLINILCNYQGFRECELILVFDAYKIKGNPGAVEKVHHISVVYTKEAETADMYIEKVTHTLGKRHRVRVATSDRLEQLIILGHGAQRVSAAAFREEVDEVERAIRNLLDANYQAGDAAIARILE